MSEPAKEYYKPSVTADVVAFNIHAAQFRDDGAFVNLILIKRDEKSKAFPGAWALPGGFIEEGEDCYQCAAREFKEETGADAKFLTLSGIYSEPGRDPRGPVISVAFTAVLPSGDFAPLKLKAGDDAKAIGLFNLSKSSIDREHDSLHIVMRCVENGAKIAYTANFGRGSVGAITTEIIYDKDSNAELAFDHAAIIARGIWQKSQIFANTAKCKSRVEHVTPNEEAQLKKELTEHLQK